MSVTLDANILVYASNTADPAHERCRALVERLATGPGLVYLFWPTVFGYLRLVTHPAVLPRPMTPAEACANIASLLDRPNVRTGAEDERFWSTYLATGGDGARGNDVPDVHLAALMRDHGVRVIYTRDRGFRRFDDVEVRDPLA